MSAVDGLIQRLEGTLATTSDGPRMSGRVRRTIGGSLEVTGFDQGLGAECLVLVNDTEVPAQVVGFSDEATFLMPLADITGVRPGAPVRAAEALRLPEPAQLMNRVIDGMGRPLDGKPLAQASAAEDILRHGGFNPLERRGVAEPLDVGVRALNALFTIGVGQRIGVFAGSGVGKSVLLGMMARFTKADAVVVGLIGERGREVVEFIDDNLGPEGRAKSVVVASPADDSPVLRIRAATLATRIAHQLRVAGKHVLLVMDSLTRVAQAQREIGLSLGEPPTTKGYPPSVFALLPKLVEQAGNLNNFTGSVTAFYTVLAEGDDQQDPIADAARAILDGHVVLSRSLADAGHFPAIDVEASISRLMPKLVDETHLKEAMDLKGLWSRYAQQQDLISVGAYAAGSDPLTDRAIALRPKLLEFLKQRSTERADLAVSRLALDHLMTEPADMPSADVVGTAQLPELTSA